MKIVRFSIDRKVRYGILKGKSIQAIEDKPFRHIKPINQYYKLGEVKLLAPCSPSKIVALGLNYHSHAKELNSPPLMPPDFLKPSTAVIGPEENIAYPPSSHRVDYEGELGWLLKSRRGRHRKRTHWTISSAIPASTTSLPATCRTRISSGPGPKALIPLPPWDHVSRLRWTGKCTHRDIPERKAQAAGKHERPYLLRAGADKLCLPCHDPAAGGYYCYRNAERHRSDESRRYG